MAIQKIVLYGSETLRTPSKEAHKVSAKIKKLVEDMYDTMYANNGVGLAAPQIGANYRIFIIDTALEKQKPNPITFINPKIIKKWGAINSYEGCLSFPGVYIYVRRYENVIIRAMDIKGRTFTLEANDGNLIARALQHEYDHLDGTVFVDHARNRFETDQILAEKGLPQINPDYLMEEQELEIQIQEYEKINPPEPVQEIEQKEQGTL
ncbi:MAG TPA: peptide deformylase [Candidatus Gastranaerophilales bacterium]|nr:peptide deformylase [Candidatus Gastranaerophilales bacterium]